VRRWSGIAALGLLALAGCGSSSGHLNTTAAREPAAARRRAAVIRHETIVAEVSDMSSHTSCREWLSVSSPARNTYLSKHWPGLHRTQVLRVVHDQNLSCRIAPPLGHGHIGMGDLQAGVDLVVSGLAVFYEETLAAGLKESIVEYLDRVSGIRTRRRSQ
jgi:hypothetical protein